MKTKLHIAILILALSQALACSKDDPNSGTAGATDLQRSWESDCLSSLTKTTATFAPTTLTTRVDSFAATGCTNLSFSRAITYNYKTTGASLDLSVVSYTLTPTSASWVSQFNTNSECGYTDWTLNQPKEIAGRTCNYFGGVTPAAGSPLYTIYSIQSSVLYLGKLTSSLDGSTPEKRPTTLSTDLPLHAK
jgi:hypothetical protein